MLNVKQLSMLKRPIGEERIAQRKGGGGKALSYLEAWDVKAHLIRIFGFGGFSADVVSADLMFEEKVGNNWNVGYKVVLRLSIQVLCATYTEAAVGFASLPSRGECHDMAIKTAESDALKRAAVYLGDQFGLSLYNNGSLKPVVGATLDGSVQTELVQVPVEPSEPVEGENPGEGDGEHAMLLAEIHSDLTVAYAIPDPALRLEACTQVQAKARAAGLLNTVMPSGVTVQRAIDMTIARGESK